MAVVGWGRAGRNSGGSGLGAKAATACGRTMWAAMAARRSVNMARKRVPNMFMG